MKGDIRANDVLAFLLELGVLVMWGLWAWSVPRGTLGKALFTLVVVGGFIALWALFFARTAKSRLHMPWLLVGKLLALLPPGLLYFQDKTPHRLVWGAIVLLHLAVGTVQKGL